MSDTQIDFLKTEADIKLKELEANAPAKEVASKYPPTRVGIFLS